MPLIRSHNIYWIRTVCVIGIILAHVQSPRLTPAALESLAAVKALIPWSTLGFLSVAGWLHSYSLRKRGSADIDFYVRRGKRLLLPFAVITCAYCLIWQVIEELELIRLNTPPPQGLWAKLIASGNFINGGWATAPQLYFLPLLFVVSSTVHLSIFSGRHKSSIGPSLILIWAAGLLTLTCAPVVRAYSDFTGLLGSFAFYCAGYLLHQLNYLRARLLLVIACSLWLTLSWGGTGAIFASPLLLIALSSHIQLGVNRFTRMIGEASGTVFIYHCPFVITPLLIAIAYVQVPKFQVIAAFLVIAGTIALLTALHHRVKTTRLSWLTL